MINYLFFGIVYSFACVVQPGPFQALLFSQSLTHGWQKTVPIVFAPIISDIPIVILVLVILTNVPHLFLRILQCVGGAFLLYLAYGAYKTWRTFHQDAGKKVTHQIKFYKAILVNIFNPGPYLGWSLIMGPQLIKAWNDAPLNGIVLVFAFYATLVICSIALIMLFATARNFGPAVSRMSIGFSVIAFAVFGIYQFWSGIIR